MVRLRLSLLALALCPLPVLAACGDDDAPVPTSPFVCGDVTCRTPVEICVFAPTGSRCVGSFELDGGFVGRCGDYVAMLCPAGSRGTVCTQQPAAPDAGVADAGVADAGEPASRPPGARVVECR